MLNSLSRLLSRAWGRSNEAPVDIELADVLTDVRTFLSLQGSVGDYVKGKDKKLFVPIVDLDGNERRCAIFETSFSRALRVTEVNGKVFNIPAPPSSLFSVPTRWIVVDDGVEGSSRYEDSRMIAMALPDARVCFAEEELAKLKMIVLDKRAQPKELYEPVNPASSRVKSGPACRPGGR